MASLHYYVFGPLDSLWAVCGRYLADSGWSDVPTFYAQVINANFGLFYDPQAIPAGTRVLLPYAR